MPDRCVDCGALIIEDDWLGAVPTAAIPDRCILLHANFSRHCAALDWTEYYMIASGLLQRRMRT